MSFSHFLRGTVSTIAADSKLSASKLHKQTSPNLMACCENGGALIINGEARKQLTIEYHRVYRNPDKKPGGDQDMKGNPGRLPEKIKIVPPGGSHLIKSRYLDASQDGRLGRPEFDFSIPGANPLTWPRHKFEGNKEYVCQIGTDGLLDITPNDGHRSNCCCSWIFNLFRKKPGPPPLSTCVAISSGDPNPEADNDDWLELVAEAVKVEGGIGGRGKEGSPEADNDDSLELAAAVKVEDSIGERGKEEIIEEVPVVAAVGKTALLQLPLKMGISIGEGGAAVAA